MRATRAAVIVLFAGLVGCAQSSSEGAPEPRSIFREITVGRGEKIVLGTPLSGAVRPLLTAVGENRYRLRPGAFGGAQSITVQVAADRRVAALSFEYASGTDFTDEVRTYRRMLGPPVHQSENVARWEDPKTVFELLQRGSSVHSVLYDRPLTGQ